MLGRTGNTSATLMVNLVDSKDCWSWEGAIIFTDGSAYLGSIPFASCGYAAYYKAQEPA